MVSFGDLQTGTFLSLPPSPPQQITHINLLSCEVGFEIQKVLKVRHLQTPSFSLFPNSQHNVYCIKSIKAL